MHALASPDPTSDAALARDAAAGDESAWAALVARHGPWLWALARRLAPENPDDAYQELWVKLYRVIGRFDPAGSASFRTWLTRVAHRALIDRHRKRSRRGEEVPLAPGVRLVDARPGPERLTSQRRRREALEGAIQRLPPAQRRVVVLHHLHGQELARIAADEGAAIGTVKSRLHRARARLAAWLKEAGR